LSNALRGHYGDESVYRFGGDESVVVLGSDTTWLADFLPCEVVTNTERRFVGSQRRRISRLSGPQASRHRDTAQLKPHVHVGELREAKQRFRLKTKVSGLQELGQ
jgi:GGDEF domain-containing protein